MIAKISHSAACMLCFLLLVTLAGTTAEAARKSSSKSRRKPAPKAAKKTAPKAAPVKSATSQSDSADASSAAEKAPQIVTSSDAPEVGDVPASEEGVEPLPAAWYDALRTFATDCLVYRSTGGLAGGFFASPGLPEMLLPDVGALFSPRFRESNGWSLAWPIPIIGGPLTDDHVLKGDTLIHGIAFAGPHLEMPDADVRAMLGGRIDLFVMGYAGIGFEAAGLVGADAIGLGSGDIMDANGLGVMAGAGVDILADEPPMAFGITVRRYWLGEHVRHEISLGVRLLGNSAVGAVSAALRSDEIPQRLAQCRQQYEKIADPFRRRQPPTGREQLALLMEMQSGDRKTRNSAARALAAYGPRMWVIWMPENKTIEILDLTPKLAEAAKDRDSEVRLAAVEALGVVGRGTPEGVAALRDALDDADGRVREAAIRLLERLPGGN